MKLGILIDSVSVVPEGEIKRRGLRVLPLVVSFEGANYFDAIEESKLVQMHENGRISIKTKSMSHTPSASDFVTYLLRNMVLDYDLIIYLATGPNFSLLHQNAAEATFLLNAKASKLRHARGIVQPFRFINIDSASAMTGVGLLAMLADELHKSGSSLKDILNKLDNVKKLVKMFVVTKDSLYAWHRITAKGERAPTSYHKVVIANALRIAPISLSQDNNIEVYDSKTFGFNKALNRVFAYCTEQVKLGLLVPMINVAYAGNIAEIRALESYKKLETVCKAYDVSLYSGVKTLASSCNLGPGGLSVSLIPIDQETRA